MLKYISILFLFLLFLSCSQKTKETEKNEEKSEMSIVKKHSTPSKLNSISSSKVKDWEEYNQLSSFLDRFANTSPNEALGNALELKKLSKMMKDSIRIEDFKTSAFKARLNVFENETLRLADMTYIPAITAKEVNDQIDKIFLIFSSLNAKINTTYNQKRFDEDINLESFFKLDSTEKRETDTNKHPEKFTE